MFNYFVQYITVLKVYFSGEITIIAFIFPWLKYFFVTMKLLPKMSKAAGDMPY